MKLQCSTSTGLHIGFLQPLTVNVNVRKGGEKDLIWKNHYKLPLCHGVSIGQPEHSDRGFQLIYLKWFPLKQKTLV